MSSLRIPLGAGEMLAICDFTSGIHIRNARSIFSSETCCLLCGSLSDNGVFALAEHTTCNKHRKNVTMYLSCSQSIRAVEQGMLNDSEESLSRRETVLRYLFLKLARANVISGIDEFNQVSVRFLLQKCSVPELIRAFSRVRAVEHSLTRGLCSVCLDRPSTMMFMACRHVCTCSMCAAKLQIAAEDSDDESISEHNKAQCPICRQVSTMVAVFLQ